MHLNNFQEAIAFNEHVSITYEHQQYQQFQQQQQLNLPTKKQKHQKTKHQQHQDHNMSLIKNVIIISMCMCLNCVLD